LYSKTVRKSSIPEEAEALQNGRGFLPVAVFFDGTIYWLADGFHSVQSEVMRKQLAARCHQKCKDSDLTMSAHFA
jgi:nicotinamide riboside kinase